MYEISQQLDIKNMKMWMIPYISLYPICVTKYLAPKFSLSPHMHAGENVIK